MKEINDGEGWKHLEKFWWLPTKDIDGILSVKKNETLWSITVYVNKLTKNIEESLWEVMIDTYGMLGGKLDFVGQRGSSDEFSKMIHSLHLSNGRAITVIIISRNDKNTNYALDYGKHGPRKTQVIVSKKTEDTIINFGLECFLPEKKGDWRNGW